MRRGEIFPTFRVQCNLLNPLNSMGLYDLRKISLGCMKPLLNPHFSCESILHSFRRSSGRSPSLRTPESHFNEFTSGCALFFNRFVKTAAHLAYLKRGRMCSAFCNSLIYRRVFLSCAPRGKFVKKRKRHSAHHLPRSRETARCPREILRISI